MESRSSGISLDSALLVLFIALKLCGVIDWSWWWVLSPAWIPITAALVIVVVVLFGMACVGIYKHYIE